MRAQGLQHRRQSTRIGLTAGEHDNPFSAISIGAGPTPAASIATSAGKVGATGDGVRPPRRRRCIRRWRRALQGIAQTRLPPEQLLRTEIMTAAPPPRLQLPRPGSRRRSPPSAAAPTTCADARRPRSPRSAVDAQSSPTPPGVSRRSTLWPKRCLLMGRHLARCLRLPDCGDRTSLTFKRWIEMFASSYHRRRIRSASPRATLSLKVNSIAMTATAYFAG
jgi:hypothetical protein